MRFETHVILFICENLAIASTGIASSKYNKYEGIYDPDAEYTKFIIYCILCFLEQNGISRLSC